MFRNICFTVLVLAPVFCDPPTFVTCKRVVQAFALKPEKWTCENKGEALDVGDHSVTYLLKDKDGRLGSCKVMKLKTTDPKDPGSRELTVTDRLKGLPNILDLYDSIVITIVNEGEVSLVIQEYAEFGTLANYRQKYWGHFVDVRQTMVFALKIVNGVKQMQNKQLVHSCLSPSTIVVTKGWVPKIGFFEYTKEMGKAGEHIGPLLYRDVRMLKFGELKKFDDKVDIYSLGAIFYFLLTGHAPIDSDTVGGTEYLIEQGEYEMPENSEGVVAAIINYCMQQNADLRPTVDQLMGFINDFLESDEDVIIGKTVLTTASMLEFDDLKKLRHENRKAWVKEYLKKKNQRVLRQELMAPKTPQTLQEKFSKIRLFLVLFFVTLGLIALLFSCGIIFSGKKSAENVPISPDLGSISLKNDLRISVDLNGEPRV